MATELLHLGLIVCMYIILSLFCFLPSRRFILPFVYPFLRPCEIGDQQEQHPPPRQCHQYHQLVQDTSCRMENSSGSGAAARLGPFIGQQQVPGKMLQLSVSPGGGLRAWNDVCAANAECTVETCPWRITLWLPHTITWPSSLLWLSWKKGNLSLCSLKEYPLGTGHLLTSGEPISKFGFDLGFVFNSFSYKVHCWLAGSRPPTIASCWG
jgi:hypothetical protein